MENSTAEDVQITEITVRKKKMVRVESRRDIKFFKKPRKKELDIEKTEPYMVIKKISEEDVA